jgi:2-C-methyl-D-erythritol 4-phosphate cytidylyltransferase
MGAAVPKVLLPVVDLDPVRSAPAVSILQCTIQVFSSDPMCDAVVVCAPVEWRERFEQELAGMRAVSVIVGGATRQESVRRAVECLGESLRVEESLPVLVHDAARCCVTRELVHRVFDGVQRQGAVTAAVKVFDALCRVSEGCVHESVEREGVWSVQTPQGFLLRDLRRAHEEAVQLQIKALDDAALVARVRAVGIVLGERFNIKITEPSDLRLAQLIVAGQGVSGEDATVKECA